MSLAKSDQEDLYSFDPQTKKSNFQFLVYFFDVAALIVSIVYILLLVFYRENLITLYDDSQITTIHFLMTLVIPVSITLSTVLMMKNEFEVTKMLSFLIMLFILTLIQPIILFLNPSLNRTIISGLDEVLLHPKGWMILLYPLLPFFVFCPLLAIIILGNRSITEKMAPISIITAFMLFLYAETAKMWNTIGWAVYMVGYNKEFDLVKESLYLKNMSGFNYQPVLWIVLSLASVSFVAGTVLFTVNLRKHDTRKVNVLPMLMLPSTYIVDNALREYPLYSQLISGPVLLVLLMITLIYGIYYLSKHQMIINESIKSKFDDTKNIKHRINRKRLENEVLYLIEENDFNNLVELSSFLCRPYHEILIAVKRLILNNHLNGQILEKRFISTDNPLTLDRHLGSNDDPLPLEIWKLTMKNQGAMSFQDLSNILDVKEHALIELFSSNIIGLDSSYFIYEDYIYISDINDVEMLYYFIQGKRTNMNKEMNGYNQSNGKMKEVELITLPFDP